MTKPNQLHFAPQVLALGIGCERGADAAEAIGLAEDVLRDGGYCAPCLGGCFLD